MGGVPMRAAPLPHSTKSTNAPGLDALPPTGSGTELGFDPECTLHDVRYGERFHVNGVPRGPESSCGCSRSRARCRPRNLLGGYAGAGQRAPSRPMYFRLGGGGIKGVSKPGEIVWSRIFGMAA